MLQNVERYVEEKNMIKYWVAFKQVTQYEILKRKNDSKAFNMFLFRYKTMGINAFKRFRVFSQKNKL